MNPSYLIDRQRHADKLRAELELLESPGPQLPGERRRVNPRTGAVTIKTICGRWVGID